MEYEKLLAEALKHVPPKYSTLEDTAIYNGMAPALYEMIHVYEAIDETMIQAFGVTSYGKWLEYIVKEVGLERFQATYSRKKGEFKDTEEALLDIPVGFRLAIKDNTFIVTKRLSKGMFELICEQSGSQPNELLGELMPIDRWPDLGKATLIDTIEKAVDLEDDEHLRERYLMKVREPATSGNIYHYRRWVMEVPGIGAVKVFPLWAGNGSVKLSIVNLEMKPADSGLIEKVATHIEEVRPIGATVTVVSAQPKAIHVTGKVKLLKGTSVESTQSLFKEALKEHFKKISYRIDYVSIAKIGNILLSIANVEDYSDLMLNSQSQNVVLSAEEIPDIATLQLEAIG